MARPYGLPGKAKMARTRIHRRCCHNPVALGNAGSARCSLRQRAAPGHLRFGRRAEANRTHSSPGRIDATDPEPTLPAGLSGTVGHRAGFAASRASSDPEPHKGVTRSLRLLIFFAPGEVAAAIRKSASGRCRRVAPRCRDRTRSDCPLSHVRAVCSTVVIVQIGRAGRLSLPCSGPTRPKRPLVERA